MNDYGMYVGAVIDRNSAAVGLMKSAADAAADGPGFLDKAKNWLADEGNYLYDKGADWGNQGLEYARKNILPHANIISGGGDPRIDALLGEGKDKEAIMEALANMGINAGIGTAVGGSSALLANQLGGSVPIQVLSGLGGFSVGYTARALIKKLREKYATKGAPAKKA